MNTRTLATAAWMSLAVAANMPSAEACQKPPGSQVPCNLVPEHPIVNKVDPFKVYFTLTNFPTTAPFPPPYMDDLTFSVITVSQPPTGTCRGPGGPGGVPGYGIIDPANYQVELDEAWSPFADEPTSDTHELIVTPVTPGDYFSVSVQVCGTPMGCQRQCTTTICIPASDDPPQDATPYAEFLEPHRAGDAGSVLPFRLRVLRNGYAQGIPLTVRVLPQNLSDPIDIFPMSPESLSTTGYNFTGNDEIVDFECSLHYPCFVGVDNNYHVTIHDGPNLLWDSRISFPGGIGRAHVQRSPLVRQELIEILDDGGDGALATGEHGFLHLRLYGRNPYFAADIVNAAVSTPIPAGLTVDRYELHYHDNPMDTYVPTPAELLALGVNASSPSELRIETSTIEARFSSGSFDPPPAVFRDLFEVEVWFETPVGGFPSPTDIIFPGAEMTGTALGQPKAERSAPLVVSVQQGKAPNPIYPLLAVRELNDVRLLWPDSVIDPVHDPALGYHVHLAGDPATGYALLSAEPETAQSVEEYLHPGAVTTGVPHYYRLSAWNADGLSADTP